MTSATLSAPAAPHPSGRAIPGAPADGRIALPGRMSLPPLWGVFVLGWLGVLGVAASRVPVHAMPAPRVAAVVACFVLLGGMYLRLTLRGALTEADMSPAGPPPALLYRRALQLVGMTATVCALVVLTPPQEMWWLLLGVVVAAGLALPSRAAVIAKIVLVALALGIGRVVSGHLDPMLLVQLAFGAGAICIRQLSITVVQLRAAREELARTAVDEERLRFARDLHDLLGHSLSMIALKSELAGRLVMDTPARAAPEIADVERAARDALRQVRAAVAGYRQPSLRAELAAARELLAAAGIAVEVHDEAGPLPPALDALLAWTVREGVTNVIRHARARCCTIRIAASEDGGARVEVVDDGCGAEGGSAGGHGLAGLGERAAAHRGSLHAGPRPEGGFRLVMQASGTPAAARSGA